MFKLSVVSPSATYALVGSVASTNEGTNVTITLNTTGVQRSQSLPFTISGTGITLEDFEGLTQLTGSFVVGADGTDTVNLSVRADQLTEGQETFTVTLLGGLASADVILNDTSLSAALFNSSTTLLLRGDGANNQNNNVFVDSSSNNFAITRVGNTTQGSFTPFSKAEGEWGVFFAEMDYFTVTPTLSFAGDFTVEGWFTSYQAATETKLFGIGNSATANGFQVFINQTSRVLELMSSSTSFRITGTTPLTYGQRYHIAAVRSGANISIYLNGLLEASLTNSSTYEGLVTVSAINFGGIMYGGISHVSNFRVTNTALYTANFTPSTSPLTAVAGTQLLTCQSNRFRDNSTNNFTITPTGTPRVVVDSPFAREYNPATMGGSVYFDGVGDRLSAPNNPAFLFGSGEFTVETWVYVNDYPATSFSYLTGVWSGLTPGKQAWGLFVRNNGTPFFAIDPADTEILTSTVSIHRRTWNHLAVTRSGNNYTMFVNGQVTHTATLAHTMQNGTGTLDFGNVHDVDWNRANVYLTDTRITKGVALYTAPFTPPAAPLTSTAQTSFLLGSTNAGIVDSTGGNVLETVGDARISTAVVRPGQTSSMFFDGSSDRLSVPALTDYGRTFLANDNTLQCWIYPQSANAPIVSSASLDSPGSNNWDLIISSSNLRLRYWNGNQVVLTSAETIPLNAWTHIALVVNNGVITLFVNGSVYASAPRAGTPSSVSVPLNIAATRNGSTGNTLQTLSGYIDDFSMSNTALYTEKFTPPTSL